MTDSMGVRPRCRNWVEFTEKKALTIVMFIVLPLCRNYSLVAAGRRPHILVEGDRALSWHVHCMQLNICMCVFVGKRTGESVGARCV